MLFSSRVKLFSAVEATVKRGTAPLSHLLRCLLCSLPSPKRVEISAVDSPLWVNHHRSFL